MLDEVNDAGLGLPVNDKVLSAIEEVVGFSVFGCFEDFIKLDWVCLMVVFDSEQEDGGEEEVEEGADDENGAAEEFTAG